MVNSESGDSERIWGRFIRFVRRQVREMGEGGLPVLLKKGRAFLKAAAFAPLAIPALLLTRALRPLVLIRIGPLGSQRIGHYAAETELYLCRRDAGMDCQRDIDIFYRTGHFTADSGSDLDRRDTGIKKRRTIDVFYNTSPICNRQLKKMWDRTLRVSPIAWMVYMLNHLLPGWKEHVIAMPSDRDIYGLLEHSQPHLSFTVEEEGRGQAALKQMGIPDNSRFTCFHVRDSSYLSTVYPGADSYSYNYLDTNMKNYLPAVEEVTRRGYFVIRMGAIVREPLNLNNPRFIDYATNYRSDFMDIFLGAKCHFFFGAPSGISSIPMIFKRPIALANFIPLEYAPSWFPYALFIPKKLWLRGERRFLKFPEILNSGIGKFLETKYYEQRGIEVIENAPEEITALVVEMDERLKGTWRMTEEDEELQGRFRALFKASKLNGTFVSRIGAEFLRQNRELLG